MTGDHFNATFSGHMYEGAHFPDGTNHGTASMMIDHHSASTTSGRYSGSGDAGTFNIDPESHVDFGRPRSDRRRCLHANHLEWLHDDHGDRRQRTTHRQRFAGAVSSMAPSTFPTPPATCIGFDATVTSCGSLDGHYQGMGSCSMLDAMTTDDCDASAPSTAALARVA